MHRSLNNFGLADEAEQFDEYGDGNQIPVDLIRQIAMGVVRGQNIIRDENALPAEDRVGRHLERAVAVF